MRHLTNTAAIALLAIAALFSAAIAHARTDSTGALTDISVSDLPGEAKKTLASIRDGGPFPYERDSVVFANREHMLPAKYRGYYHEFTVKTPGVRSRGARRIICGGDLSTVSDCYYTDDHYQSFRRIRQ
jgi:ribonuclease T1